MKIRLPEYGNCIANLACSILRYYGLDAPNATLKQADELLRREFQNVVLILLDGMGTSTVKEHLSPDGFFRNHLRCSYSSTFPPTTVAATTAVMSGLYPNQSAWLGWTGYFDEIDRNVVYFMNKDNDTGEKIQDINVAATYVPFPAIQDSIAQTGVRTHWLTSWMSPACKTYSGMMEEILRLCEQDARSFIYAYWEEPDNTMHKKGVSSEETKALVQQLEDLTAQLSNQLQNTLLFVTADHGLIDSKTLLFCEDHALMQCLVRPPSIESRAMNLFVKEEQKQYFEKLFRSRYSENYQLLPMEEVMARNLFGTGSNHDRLPRMLGNYLAIATGEVTLRMKDKKFVGEHAGLTFDEMTIPLIAFSLNQI